jgi:hypothetical protein
MNKIFLIILINFLYYSPIFSHSDYSKFFGYLFLSLIIVFLSDIYIKREIFAILFKREKSFDWKVVFASLFEIFCFFCLAPILKLDIIVNTKILYFTSYILANGLFQYVFIFIDKLDEDILFLNKIMFIAISVASLPFLAIVMLIYSENL